MTLNLSDTGRAGLVGTSLLVIAAYAVFGFQHGFEEQVAWYLVLLPGAIIAAAIVDTVRHTVPSVERVAFWGLLFGLNFLWYFGICFVAIKVYRFVSNVTKNP